VIHAWPAASARPLAVDAWLRGHDLVELEEKLAVYNGLPYLDQLKDAAQIGELGLRLAETQPGLAQDGRERRTCGSRHHAQGRQGQAPVGHRRRGREGYSLAAARAEAERCLQCECPASETASCRNSASTTASPTTTSWSRRLVRDVAAQHEHPFIRRDMDRCIACGRCVRTCRDVAGPACYDFTGRGFTINVDTPYSEALQLADCITCGRCVNTCPTGALTFNERELASYRVDESRCILCKECVNVCPVEAIKETNHFEDARGKWLELVDQGSQLAGGHRMCAGLRRADRGASGTHGHQRPVVVSAATGCLEVSTTIYPYTSWKGSYIHTAFENAAATLSGVETAFRASRRRASSRRTSIHRLRRRRRHLRHRSAGALRRHGARPQHALRLLRQWRLHEQPASSAPAPRGRRLDDHQPGGQGDVRQAAEP